jgi:hypothetical protein
MYSIHLLSKFDENQGKTDHHLEFICVSTNIQQGKKLCKICYVIYLIVNHVLNNKFTYRTDNNTDLLFQVNNNCKTKNTDRKPCWSKKSNLSKKLDRKEESIPSCSSNRRNSLVAEVAEVADAFRPNYCSWTGD